jgi:low affinity Fe/Cu permease
MMKLFKACIEGMLFMVVAIILWIFFGEVLGIDIDWYWSVLSLAVVAYIIISFIKKLINGDSD